MWFGYVNVYILALRKDSVPGVIWYHMSSVYRPVLYEGYPGSVLPRLRHDEEFRCNNEVKTSEPFALVHKTFIKYQGVSAYVSHGKIVNSFIMQNINDYYSQSTRILAYNYFKSPRTR